MKEQPVMTTAIHLKLQMH